MLRPNLARPLVLAVALLMPTACSDDEGATAPAPTSTSLAADGAPAASSTSSTLAGTTTTAAARLIEVTYAGGQVAGGAQRISVGVGEKVRIRVTSDVADEVHVHTYDLRSAAAPGQPAQIDLVASIPGRHEVELEKKGRQLMTLEVR